MAPDRHSDNPVPVFIDLVSDDSDMEPITASPTRDHQLLRDDFADDFLLGDEAYFDELANPVLPEAAPTAVEPERRGTIINVGGEDVFIPDEEDPRHIPGAFDVSQAYDQDTALALDGQAYSAEQCLQQVLEIFQDIDHEHVLKLYNEFDVNEGYENVSGPARFESIVEQLLASSSYPKQQKGKGALKKRKREDSASDNDNDRWERPGRETVPRQFQGPMRAILKADFPEIPQVFIKNTLTTHVHLYQAYVALTNARHSFDPANPAYSKGRASVVNGLANAVTIATSSGFPALVDELKAAQTRAAVIKGQRAAEIARKMAEQANLERAKERGETAECSACYDDLPMNRMIHCDSSDAHFTCYECAETYIKSEVGDSRCNVVCPSGCGSSFAYGQLQLLPDKQLLQKLAELEQEKAIRDAGLDDLEECPFCDYKVILPPIEQDFEFRCANPECEKVSCRRCKAISHIPLSCEQHAKDNKISSRHKIEEAMTAALIRHCNKCKKQFIKDYGCNKMTCPSCGNLQCYVCSASLTDYNHFDQQVHPGRRLNVQAVSKCPLYDNVEERHEREVKEAEAAARAQVIEDHPDVDAGDLEIKVSDAVKRATQDRIQRAGANGMGLPWMPGHLPIHGGAADDPRFGVFPGAEDGAQDLNLVARDILAQDLRMAHLATGGRYGQAQRGQIRQAQARAMGIVPRPLPVNLRRVQPPVHAPQALPMANAPPPRGLAQGRYAGMFDFNQANAAPAAPYAQHGPNDNIIHRALARPIFAPGPAPQMQDYDPYNYMRPFGHDGAADLQARFDPMNFQFMQPYARQQAGGRIHPPRTPLDGVAGHSKAPFTDLPGPAGSGSPVRDPRIMDGATTAFGLPLQRLLPQRPHTGHVDNFENLFRPPQDPGELERAQDFLREGQQRIYDRQQGNRGIQGQNQGQWSGQ